MTKHIADWPAAVVESSNEAIVAHDGSGVIVIWNQAACALFGYTAEEVMGRPIDMLFPPAGLEEERRVRAQLAQDGDIPSFCTVMRARNGDLVEVSATLSQVISTAGVTLGASRVLRDAADRRQRDEKRLEAERLDHENRQLLEAGRLKSVFLGSMSHELRTPLISIIGFTDLLYSGAVDVASPKHHEFLGYISTSSHHLLHLINDLLDASKAALGTLESSTAPARLTVLVEHTLEILQPLIRHKGLVLSCDVDPEVDTLELDASRLGQVVYGILSNAITCARNEGRVSIRAGPHGSAQFCLEVEDDGMGVAELTAPGLAVARRLIEAQGGSVGVCSVRGGGTIVRFVLNRRHGTGGQGLEP